MTVPAHNPDEPRQGQAETGAGDNGRQPGPEAERAQVTRQLEELLDERTAELRVAQTRLAMIQGSASYRMAQQLTGTRGRFAPVLAGLGTTRRYALRALELWLDRGLSGLLSKVADKFKSRLFGPRRHQAAAARGSEPGQSHRTESILFSLDHPNLNGRPVLFGTTQVDGWALAQGGIETIEVYVDGQLAGATTPTRFRPDVGTLHPGFEEGVHAGFSLSLDTARWPDGRHRFRLRVVSRPGAASEIIGRVTIDNAHPRPEPYDQWIAANEPGEIAEARQRVGLLEFQPLISLVMPVYNTEGHLLQAAIASVRAQAYENWELCICDDGSTRPEVRPILEAALREEPRLRVKFLETNGGITVASAEALALAQGEFMALMDSDDELPPHALYQVAKLLNAQPDADLIYSDEDKMDEAGRRYEPFFKPDWSPDLLLSCNYVAHFTTIRLALARSAGGFVPGCEGSQDYDLYLRVIERTAHIHHIPKILYHWRATASSTASGATVRLPAHEAAQRALEAHLRRCQIDAAVLPGNALGRWRIHYAIAEPPRVAVIMPTGGNLRMLNQCLAGLGRKTSWPKLEIVIVDNSRDDAVRQLIANLAAAGEAMHYLDRRGEPFNYSRLNNEAVRESESPLILFLNDDIVPVNDDWLAAMVEHAQRPEVGAVGAKLIYPGGGLQHAGVVMGLYANSGHAFKHLPADERQPVYFDLPHVTRNCSAVTAACMLVRREVFWQVGGFDEIHLAVAFQDVDLCLKMRERGYRILYTPHARLVHHEAVTKAEKIPNPYEVEYMQRKWAHVIAHDPFYNPNLTRLRDDFSLALPL